MKSFKVLFFLQGLEFGGLEKMACDLAINLKKKGIEVEVCCFDTKGELSGGLTSEGISVFLLRRNRGLDFKCPFKLARFVKEKKFQIIHAHNSTAWFYSFWAGMLAKTPVVYTEHDRSFPTPFFKKTVYRFFGRYSKVIAVSSAVKNNLEMFDGIKNVKVILNGIDGERFSPPSADEKSRCRKLLGLKDSFFIITCVGRMDELKNQSVLIKMLLNLNKKVRLLLVGDGKKRGFLENLAGSLNVEERVFFLGKRNDVDLILRASDVFVLPSLSEGLPLAVIEAMATGIPVVASKVGGIPEMVLDGVNGFLVDPASVEEIKRSIEAFVFNDSLIAKMGKASRIIFEKRFSLSRMVKDYITAYKEVL